MRSNVIERRISLSPLVLSRGQLKLDALVENFSHEALNTQTIAAMTVGSAVFRLMRLGTLNLAGRSISFAANALSYTSALTAEVVAFRGTHSLFEKISGRTPVESVFNGQGFFRTFTDFLALKGVGGICAGQNIFVSHSLQSSTMVASRHLNAFFGFLPTPQGSLAEQFVEAESSNIALGLGASLAHRIAPSLTILEKGFDLSTQTLRQTYLESPGLERSSLSCLSMQAEEVQRRELHQGDSNHIALVSEEGLTSYAELARRSKRIESFLSSLGAQENAETVGIFFEGGNRKEFFEISLAARRAGLVYSLFSRFMNPKIIVEELTQHPYKVLFLDSKAFSKFSAFFPQLREKGIHIVDVDNQHSSFQHYNNLPPSEFTEANIAEYNDLETIIYRPIPSGFERVLRTHPMLENYSPFPIDSSDVHLVADYLFHEGNLRLAYAHLEAGATVHMPSDRSIPNLHRLIEEAKVTTLLLHPWYVDRFYDEQMRYPRDLSSLRRVIVYAAHFDAEQRKKAEEIFGTGVIHHIYSTTNQGIVSSIGPHELRNHPNSVGRAVEGVEIEIREGGAVYVKTPFTEGRFETTEERGILDHEGYLTLGPSEQQYPSTRGTLVDTSLVEAGISRISAVNESHVFGISDAYSGETIVAAVVLKTGENMSAASIQHALIATLPDNRHVPKKIIFLTSLPRLPDGRINKEALMQRMSEGT